MDVGAAIARAGEIALSDGASRSSTRGEGVLRGFGVSSSFGAAFDFAVFSVLPDVSLAPDFLFAVLGFGVGVWRRFVCDEGLGL